MKRIVILTIIGSVILSGCAVTDFFTNLVTGKLPTIEITLETDSGDVPLTVEVADDTEERAQGLMEREKLDEGTGMWFIFDDERVRHFWMKNTLIPLDIIYLNSKKEVVKIVEAANPCTTPDCPTYSSDVPAMYTLEVPAGFAKAKGVRLGDTVAEEK